MITRRQVLAAASVGVGMSATRSTRDSAASSKLEAFRSSLRKLEKESSGRLGVALRFAGSAETTGVRLDERFPMCSTFKLLLSAAILKQSELGDENLEQAVDIPADPLLSNSPLTEQHAGAQMTARELCRAVMVRSDNTAANLLLAILGGPEGITRFARSIGDPITRLDRTELALNEAIPGDQRDTTSPAAMVGDMHTLLLGNILSTSSRDLLTSWMIDNQTGNDRLRAGFPSHWRIGDKTGSNGKNTTNDIAIVWPVQQPPILVSAYLTECPGPEEKRNAVLAKVGRLVVAAVSA